jgi:hypothetical protein
MPFRRVSWPLIGLVAAVVLSFIAACTNLAGTFDSPGIDGSPHPTYTVDAPVLPEGLDEVTPHVAWAWSAVAGAAQSDWAGGDAPRFQAMADTLLTHWRVLTGGNPLARVDPGEGTPAEPSLTADAGTGLNQANGALLDLVAIEWAHAQAATGTEAAWWAGLAGAAEQVRGGLWADYETPAPLDRLAILAPVTDAEAAAALMNAYHEGIFITGAAIGRLSSWAVDPARATLEQLRRGRDALIDLAAAQGWATPTAEPAYDLPPLDNDGECADAVGAAVRGVTRAATEWLASTQAYHDDALAALRPLAGLGLGHDSAVWVGWPG